MKRTFILLVSFICFSIVSAQNMLDVTFHPNSQAIYLDYHVYKNDSIIFKECSSESPFEKLTNLKDGTYFITYNTVFGIDSTYVELKNEEFIFLTLENETLDEKKLKSTYSYIESLENQKQIVINYYQGGCFSSNELSVNILKNNNIYYKIRGKKKEKISYYVLSQLIDYEKNLMNIKLEENLEGSKAISNCSETIEFILDSKTIFKKRIYCGDWSRARDIVDLIE